MPVKPRIDHGQGLNLFNKLFEKMFSSSSPLLGEWKPSKYGETKRCRNSGDFIRKQKRKKKRIRKIAYQSVIEYRIKNKPNIRV